MRLLTIILITLSTATLFASPPDWVDNPGAYQFTATISGGIVLNIADEQMGEVGDMFAAFDDDGNVRGVGLMLFPPFGPYQGTPVFEVQLRSNDAGDILHFKYYDASTHIIFDINETYTFMINDIIGNVEDPEMYNMDGNGIIEVYYSSDVDIGGFQFDVEGVTVTGASGGAAEVAGFMITASSTTVIGFSLSGVEILAGCGILVTLDIEDIGEPCFENTVISDNSGNPLDAEVVDCTTINLWSYIYGCSKCTVFKENYLGKSNICVPMDFASAVQSSFQAFYMFNVVIINEIEVESDDWVGAFNGDVCVGARQWDTTQCGSGICDVPVLGDDGSDDTNGYMVNGDFPTFKIYDASSGESHHATPSEIESWANLAIVNIASLEVMFPIPGCTDDSACNYDETATADDGSCLENDCAGDCGGNAVLSGCDNVCGSTLENDECGVCGGDGIPNGDCDCEGNLDTCSLCPNIDLNGYGNCGDALGYAFTGIDCESATGCGYGTDEEWFFDTYDECSTGCQNCKILDADGYGFCEMVLGWGWTGEACELISGCGMGDDSPWFYETEDICGNRCHYGYNPGCTDPYAANYNPEATINDGSCTDNSVVNYEEFTFVGTHNEHYYYLYNYLSNWHNAKIICENNTGHLLTITSEAEDSFISGVISISSWLGLTDETNEGQWDWITDEPLNYTNWDGSEPNGGNEENYLERHASGYWNDLRAESSLSFILELESGGGCTNNTACNYDVTATMDDGSCEYCSCQTCSGHGTCVDGGANYTCTCNSFYIGTNCETDIDECFTDNGGCGDATYYLCTNNVGASATCVYIPKILNVPNEYSTIQSAIDASSTGDTILVVAGTYTENIDYGGKNIVVISSHGAKQTTIIPYNTGITIVWFANDETRTAKLIGFTLLNGGDLRGGAINIEGASPTIENCILINSKSHAVNSWNSSPKFINCLFTGTDGKPIYFNSNYAYPEVINCTFVNNNDYGLFNSHNYIPDIKNCIIYNNTDGGVFGQFEINYSNIEGGWYYGVGNIDTDPLFCDPTIGDYSIAQNSPCVGSGENGANMGAFGIGCTEPAIYGCTTATACNYDSNAFNDDGSCTYAEENYDCDGICINDSNGDGVCDELSLFKGLIPEDFSIHSIYPNPFNPVTNIIYGLPEHANVQIVVYDLSGQQIETLISEFQTPGYHSVNWDAGNLPSGVYLIRMDSGDFTQTQKVVLVK